MIVFWQLAAAFPARGELVLPGCPSPGPTLSPSMMSVDILVFLARRILGTDVVFFGYYLVFL